MGEFLLIVAILLVALKTIGCMVSRDKELRTHKEWLENMKKVSSTGTFDEIRAAARDRKFK
jgi:hypothetical protein